MQIDIICATRGSQNVSRDAWAEWDVTGQQWVLRTAFDYAYCHSCETEARLDEIVTAP